MGATGSVASFTAVEIEVTAELRALNSQRVEVRTRREAIALELTELAAKEVEIDTSIARCVESLLTMAREHAPAAQPSAAPTVRGCGVFDPRASPGYSLDADRSCAVRASDDDEYAAAVCDRAMEPGTGVHRWIMRITRDVQGEGTDAGSAEMLSPAAAGSVIFGVCSEALPIGSTAVTHTSSKAVGFVCSGAGSVRGRIGDASSITGCDAWGGAREGDALHFELDTHAGTLSVSKNGASKAGAHVEGLSGMTLRAYAEVYCATVAVSVAVGGEQEQPDAARRVI